MRFEVLGPAATLGLEWVSKNDEFCIKNEELCIKSEDLCIKNGAFCIKNDELCSTTATTQVTPHHHALALLSGDITPGGL